RAGLLRAARVVAALAADVVDAHFRVPAAVAVVVALRVRRRLGTAEEQGQGQGSKLAHVRALTTVQRSVKHTRAPFCPRRRKPSPRGAAPAARVRGGAPPNGPADA